MALGKSLLMESEQTPRDWAPGSHAPQTTQALSPSLSLPIPSGSDSHATSHQRSSVHSLQLRWRGGKIQRESREPLFQPVRDTTLRRIAMQTLGSEGGGGGGEVGEVKPSSLWATEESEGAMEEA